MAIKIIGAYDFLPSQPTPSGSDLEPDFGYVKKTIVDYDVDGKKTGEHEEIVFEKVGEHSISEYINSFNDTTDIRKIFERYQVGDVSVLTKRVGDYMDTVGCPETLLDAKLMMMNGEKTFNELPASIREKYENDPFKFIQACQDGSIADVITGLKTDGEKTIESQKGEIEQLRAQLAELQKGGVNYE